MRIFIKYAAGKHSSKKKKVKAKWGFLSVKYEKSAINGY